MLASSMDFSSSSFSELVCVYSSITNAAIKSEFYLEIYSLSNYCS